MLELGATSFRVEYLLIKYESPHHVFDNDQKQKGWSEFTCRKKQ